MLAELPCAHVNVRHLVEACVSGFCAAEICTLPEGKTAAYPGFLSLVFYSFSLFVFLFLFFVLGAELSTELNSQPFLYLLIVSFKLGYLCLYNSSPGLERGLSS